MKTKLLSYSGAASVFLLAGAAKADAQVIYHDIDPDVYMTGDPDDYFLDVNMDGEHELKFGHTTNALGAFWGCYGNVTPNYSYCLINNYVYTYTYGWEFGAPLDAGDPVPFGFNNPPVAINVQYLGAGWDTGVGLWVGEGDKYFGFQFYTPDGIDGPYYGWVRLQADECGYYIKDYAYAEGGIDAGEGMPLDGCDTPTGMAATGIEAEKVKISWDAVAGATTYNVRFRAVGEIDWHEKTVDAPKTFVKLKALSCDTDYEWQVQADCDGGPSEYTEIAVFSTLSCRIGDLADAGFDIYPNPANTLLNVELENELNGDVFMQITDFTGKIVLQQNLTSTLTGVDLTELPSGIYILTVFENGNMNKKEFIKQ